MFERFPWLMRGKDVHVLAIPDSNPAWAERTVYQVQHQWRHAAFFSRSCTLQEHALGCPLSKSEILEQPSIIAHDLFKCNGFSAGINPDTFRGPGFKSGYDPMWVDLLQKHAQEPFHVLVGGGDQLYCDSYVPTCLALEYTVDPLLIRMTREPELQDWVHESKASVKQSYPLTPEIAACIDRFLFNHYCASFRHGAFARANSSM